jgi:hypothetical protein
MKYPHVMNMGNTSPSITPTERRPRAVALDGIGVGEWMEFVVISELRRIHKVYKVAAEHPAYK